MLQGTAHLEVLGEVVLPVNTEHRLSLLSKVGVTLQRHVDVCSCVNDALVKYRHLSGAVIYAVIYSFGEFLSSCRHYNGTLWHVVCSQRDDVGVCSSVLSYKLELILLGILLRRSLR